MGLNVRNTSPEKAALISRTPVLALAPPLKGACCSEECVPVKLMRAMAAQSEAQARKRRQEPPLPSLVAPDSADTPK